MKDDLTELTQVKEMPQEICGNCKFRFPEQNPIPVPLPPGCRKSSVVRPGMAEMMPLMMCNNPLSPKGYMYLHPKCGCAGWEAEEPKKESDSEEEAESKIIVN